MRRSIKEVESRFKPHPFTMSLDVVLLIGLTLGFWSSTTEATYGYGGYGGYPMMYPGGAYYPQRPVYVPVYVQQPPRQPGYLLPPQQQQPQPRPNGVTVSQDGTWLSYNGIRFDRDPTTGNYVHRDANCVYYYNLQQDRWWYECTNTNASGWGTVPM